MNDRAWLHERLAESPTRLGRQLGEIVGSIPPDAELAEALLEASCERLDAVRTRLGHRESAFELLLADGLLTLACEAAARSGSEDLADRCRRMGPGGRLGRLAASWRPVK